MPSRRVRTVAATRRGSCRVRSRSSARRTPGRSAPSWRRALPARKGAAGSGPENSRTRTARRLARYPAEAGLPSRKEAPTGNCSRARRPQNRVRHAINVVPSLLDRPWDAKFFGRIPKDVCRQSSCDGPDEQSSRRRSGPMSPVIITLLVFLVVGLLLALWLMGIYNGLVVAGNPFKNAFAQIDVQLKRRYELIPNLVEAVKGYMGHERETLNAVIKARNSAMAAEQKVAANPSDPAAMRELNQAEAQLGGILGRLFALSEAYPDLKANQNMLALQEELTSTENKIGFARQAFNDAATNYNIRREVFPAVKVAGMFGFKEAALLETAETERAAPKVSFQ